MNFHWEFWFKSIWIYSAENCQFAQGFCLFQFVLVTLRFDASSSTALCKKLRGGLLILEV